MIDDGDLKVFREPFLEALPDRAEIQRRTPTSDGGGGRTYAWPVIATVACRISPIRGGEGGSKGSRVVEETTHVVTLAHDQDIEEPDRVVVAGMTYEVTYVRKRGRWALSRRVEVKEMP